MFAAKRAFIAVFVPASAIKEFLSGILAMSPEQAAIPGAGGTARVSVHAVNPTRFRRPMLRLPQDKDVFMVWLFRGVPANNAPALARLRESNRGLLARITAVGAKRYSPYSGVMASAEWAAHFGPEAWGRLSAGKKKYDPNNVLSPGPAMFAAATE